MAKAQAVKPKSSVGGFFKRFSGGGKSQPARPAAAVQSTTMTNLQAASGPATKPGKRAAAAPKKAERQGMAMTSFRLPFLGDSLQVVRYAPLLRVRAKHLKGGEMLRHASLIELIG